MQVAVPFRASARLIGLLSVLLIAISAVFAGFGAAEGAEPPRSLRIMAPAAPGGGWDQTSRMMQQVLQQEGIVPAVEVFNVPGAGGTIGLARLATTERGKGDILMMMGAVMVGSIQTNQAPVGLDQTTPIARLTAEYEVIVVPAGSPYRTLGELLEAFKANPGAVSWAGGSAGGIDHILVGLIAKAVGVPAGQINYIPFSGGGEALASLLGGHVTAGVSGYGEWLPQIEAGQLRALAVSSEERIPGTSVPTLREQGVDVALANWRGVVAPPGIRSSDGDALVEAVTRMRNSAAWKEVLRSREWNDAFLAGDAFARFVKEENERVTQVLADIGLIQR